VEREGDRTMPGPSDLIAKRARALRRALTEPEAMLWSRLKGRGGDRPVFRRQHAFGTIIFDFYCVPAKLAVEIDGSTHWDEEARAKDEARDIWAMRQGSRCSGLARASSIVIRAA